MLDERRAFRTAVRRLEPGSPAQLELHVGPDAEPWHVTVAAVPRSSPRTLTVTFHRDPSGPLPQPRSETRRLQYFMLRFPYAVVALRPDMRVLFANARARTVLGRDAVRTGAPFTAPALVRALAARLVNIPAPLSPTLLDLDDRTVRVSGIAATADDPALLLLEDVTEQYRRDRVMHEFLRNAAHQLRTPLAGIASAVETLQSGAKEVPEHRDRFLAHIETHADRLSRLTRGLLTLARFQAGERVAIDLVELAPVLERVAAEASPADGVELLVRCRPDVAVLAAPDLLQETIASLVDNAVAHTREGSIRVAAHEEGPEVSIAVADNGPGVLPEFRERIFEPFFRVAHDGSDGYGLGLAIAARAAQAMGGRIEVEATPGGGTTFSVTLRSAVADR